MTIEDYLRELRAKLRVGSLRKRRILREIEGHLLDVTREELRAGATLPDAEARAIARIGPAESLAARFSRGGVDRRWLVVALGFATAAGATAAALVLLSSFGSSGPRKLIMVGHPTRGQGHYVTLHPIGSSPKRELAATPSSLYLGGVRLVVAHDPSDRRRYLGTEIRSGQSISHSFSPIPLNEVSIGQEGSWGASGGELSGGWDLSISPTTNAPVALFQVAVGRRPRQPKWMALLGLARSGVTRIVGTTAAGKNIELKLNRRRAFAYWSRDPGRLPRSVSAFDDRRVLLGEIALPDLQTACAVEGCGGNPDESPDFSFTVSAG